MHAALAHRRTPLSVPPRHRAIALLVSLSAMISLSPLSPSLPSSRSRRAAAYLQPEVRLEVLAGLLVRAIEHHARLLLPVHHLRHERRSAFAGRASAGVASTAAGAKQGTCMQRVRSAAARRAGAHLIVDDLVLIEELRDARPWLATESGSQKVLPPLVQLLLGRLALLRHHLRARLRHCGTERWRRAERQRRGGAVAVSRRSWGQCRDACGRGGCNAYSLRRWAAQRCPFGSFAAW